jgi:hypothetical protein
MRRCSVGRQTPANGKHGQCDHAVNYGGLTDQIYLPNFCSLSTLSNAIAGATVTVTVTVSIITIARALT